MRILQRVFHSLIISLDIVMVSVRNGSTGRRPTVTPIHVATAPPSRNVKTVCQIFPVVGVVILSIQPLVSVRMAIFQVCYRKCCIISNTYLFLFSKCWFSGLEFTKCLSEKQTGKILIRLLQKKQSDLVLSCLSRLLWQTTTV